MAGWKALAGRFSFYRPLHRACLLAILLGFFSIGTPLGAADPTDPDASAVPFSAALFVEQLATGEFAPALAAATQIPAAAERDLRLAELSAAQAQGGDRAAALQTLLQMVDDRSRSAAIEKTNGGQPKTGQAGGSQADFDTLIDLITTTVRPQTWDEVGGPGSVSPFRNGVYVDASGELKRVLEPRRSAGLAVAHLASLPGSGRIDRRLESPLRKVSLTRLERQVQLGLAQGFKPNDEMLHLAGLEKINYVLIYPETGDIVLAGPAGPWRTDDEGRQVSRQSGRPVLQLDDLVVVFRHVLANPQANFGCSIDPTTEGLARTRQFAEQSSATPLKHGERPKWLKILRAQMGQQTISVQGLDPRTRAARVLVEADYRMKLVGMGLEPGLLEVPSYLNLIQVKPGENPPPLSVLRWWFTLKYDAVLATPDRNAFEIRGPGAQVLSENELLTKLGEQVHTGTSDVTNQEFAQRFSRHFEELARKYPIYAELQNVFDLALVAALVQSEKLADRVGWHLTCFGKQNDYAVALGSAPTRVDTVINHRSINGRHLIVGVSGGVQVEPWKFVEPRTVPLSGALGKQRERSAAKELPIDAWWWD